jgi:hypothetical protein
MQKTTSVSSNRTDLRKPCLRTNGHERAGSNDLPECRGYIARESYFTAKSEHKPVATTDHFSGAHLTYVDAALGWPFHSKRGMTDLFQRYMPK